MARSTLSGILLFMIVATIGVTSCSRSETTTSDTDSLALAVDSSNSTSVIDQRFQKIEAYYETAPVNGNDEELVESDCAFLINPTDEQITAMIKEYGEEDFSTIADDNAWYQSSARMLLDSIGVRVESPSKRYLELVGANQRWILDLRRPGALPWNLIFFSTKKGPQIFSTVDLTAEEIREYFDLKPLPEHVLELFKAVSDKYTLGDGLPQQFLEADFSGDKKQDIALWVERKDDGKKGIIFFIEGTADPIIVGAGNEFSHAGDDFKWAGIWEVIDARLTEETTFATEGDVAGSKPVALERPAISIRELEGSGGLIYFDGKKFTWIHQGD